MKIFQDDGEAVVADTVEVTPEAVAAEEAAVAEESNQSATEAL